MKEECENNGVSLNASETKILLLERNEERTEYEITVNGKILEQVNEVIYLRRIFNRDNRYEMNAKKRIAFGIRTVSWLH